MVTLNIFQEGHSVINLHDPFPKSIQVPAYQSDLSMHMLNFGCQGCLAAVDGLHK